MNDAAFLRGVKKYRNDEKKLSDFVAAYRAQAIKLYEKSQAHDLKLPAWLPAMWLGERFPR